MEPQERRGDGMDRVRRLGDLDEEVRGIMLVWATASVTNSTKPDR